MSEMSRGSVGDQGTLDFPHKSPPIPGFIGEIPTDPHRSPNSGDRSPFPALYSGDRGSLAGDFAPTGTSRTPRVRVHSRCHAPILAGLDAAVAALSVAVDPYPLTPAGEVWALQAGRRTYALQWGTLERRDRWTIPGQPPSPKLPVLAEHVCDSPIPPEHRAPPTPRPTPTEVEF